MKRGTDTWGYITVHVITQRKSGGARRGNDSIWQENIILQQFATKEIKALFSNHRKPPHLRNYFNCEHNKRWEV